MEIGEGGIFLGKTHLESDRFRTRQFRKCCNLPLHGGAEKNGCREHLAAIRNFHLLKSAQETDSEDRLRVATFREHVLGDTTERAVHRMMDMCGGNCSLSGLRDRRGCEGAPCPFPAPRAFKMRTAVRAAMQSVRKAGLVHLAQAGLNPLRSIMRIDPRRSSCGIRPHIRWPADSRAGESAGMAFTFYAQIPVHRNAWRHCVTTFQYRIQIWHAYAFHWWKPQPRQHSGHLPPVHGR